MKSSCQPLLLTLNLEPIFAFKSSAAGRPYPEALAVAGDPPDQPTGRTNPPRPPGAPSRPGAPPGDGWPGGAPPRRAVPPGRPPTAAASGRRAVSGSSEKKG